jgi:hypothetical protein
MNRNKGGGGFGRGGRRGVGGGLSYREVEFCMCPQCGYKESHQMGDPCNMKKCQRCGALMIRP